MTQFGRLLLAATLLTPQAAMAAGDVVQGRKLYLQCRACHTVGPEDKHGVGPNLNGVVGRKAGTRTGYSYSSAMVKSGVAWTTASLDAFLERPSALVPGTKMAFPGVAAQKSRDDLIAYLSTLKSAK